MKARGLVGLFSVLVGCSVLPAQQKVSRSIAAQQSNYSFPQLTFDKLLEVSKTSSTLEAALATLQAKYPEYMLTHTLVYDSLSIQKATLEEPRVIVFGPDARFVFSFNGGPGKSGGAAFETMQFDEDSGAFLFREIAFKRQLAEHDKSEYTDARTESQNENVIWTKANTDRCTQCHGDNAGPIFDTYFIWPGFYGSNDDFLTTPFVRKEIQSNPNYKAAGLDHAFGVSQGRDFKLHDGVKDAEVEGFKRFLKAKHAHPRYAFLPDRGIDKGFYRWLSGEAPETIDVSDEVEKNIATGAPGNALVYYSRPNLNFMERLQRLLAVKFIKQMSADKKKSYLAGQLAYQEICSEAQSKLSYLGSERTPNIGEYMGYWAKDPLEGTATTMTEEMRREIRAKAGSWRAFYKKFLLAELALEAEKISRLEQTFGKNTFHDVEGNSSLYYRPVAGFYPYHLGHKLNRYERMVAGKETDSLYDEARRDYMARGLGVDLSEYVTNLRRVATFREGGFQRIAFRILGLDGSDGYSNELRIEACAKMKSQLVSGTVDLSSH